MKSEEILYRDYFIDPIKYTIIWIVNVYIFVEILISTLQSFLYSQSPLISSSPKFLTTSSQCYDFCSFGYLKRLFGFLQCYETDQY